MLETPAPQWNIDGSLAKAHTGATIGGLEVVTGRTRSPLSQSGGNDGYESTPIDEPPSFSFVVGGIQQK